MNIKKSTIIIITLLLLAGVCAIFGSKNIYLKSLEIILLIIALALVYKKATKNYLELKNPSKNTIPKILLTAKSSGGGVRIAMGIFFCFSAIFNMFHPFLGYGSAAGVLPNSFQYTFSVVLLLLGLYMIFLGLINTSKNFATIIFKNYKIISVITFYFIVALFIMLIVSMIVPFIWN